MTREEEIIEASQLYAKAFQKPFLDGALWADKNTSEEIIKKIVGLYKQWYSEQLDISVEKYIKSHLKEKDDAGKI